MCIHACHTVSNDFRMEENDGEKKARNVRMKGREKNRVQSAEKASQDKGGRCVEMRKQAVKEPGKVLKSKRKAKEGTP